MQEKVYKCDGCGQPIQGYDGEGYNGRITDEIIVLIKSFPGAGEYEKAQYHLHPNHNGACFGKLIDRFHQSATKEKCHGPDTAAVDDKKKDC